MSPLGPHTQSWEAHPCLVSPPIAAVAMTNVAGLEGQLERVLGMAALGRTHFTALVGQAQLF